MISIPAFSSKCIISAGAARASCPGSFHLLTFGCQMNVRDSRWLAASLKMRGWRETPLPEADIVLINTCSVRAKPEQKLMSAIRRIGQLAPGARIAVLGCVAQQLGEELFAASAQICLVAGGDNLDSVPDAIMQLIATPQATISLLGFSQEYRERENVAEPLQGRSAFVNIMQGCDNFCAYCIVPYTRGREKSRNMAAIIAECQARINQGAIEITLLGQNVNAWRDGGHSFPSLLRAISLLPGLERLRFVTPHPKDFSPETIACLADIPQICPALHLPLQAGSDKVLAAMRRQYSSEKYLHLVRELRTARPDLALTTDLIAGFPGETENDFEQTLAMMEKCGFAASYSFCYSDRPGTAASRLSDKLADEIKLARLARIQALQESLTKNWLEGRVGQQATLLVESPSPRGPAGSWQGRDAHGTCCHVCLGDGDHRGRLIDVRITAAKRHCLLSEISAS